MDEAKRAAGERLMLAERVYLRTVQERDRGPDWRTRLAAARTELHLAEVAVQAILRAEMDDDGAQHHP